MAVETPILTQAKVKVLTSKEGGLAFSNHERTTLDRWIDLKKIAEQGIQSTVDKFAAQVECFAAAILEAEARVATVGRLLAQSRQQVSQDRSGIGAVFDGIRREVLADVNFRPPFFLVPLKLLAKRKPHPKIVLFEESLNKTRQEFEAVNARAQQQTNSLGFQIYPEIDTGYEYLEMIENNILASCRKAAINSNEGIKLFVKNVPWQAEKLVELYAEKKVEDEGVLGEYQEFVKFMYDRFKYPTQISDHRMTPEEYRKLDKRVKDCWQAYVGYRKLMELSQEGLVPEPPVSAVIDRVGANIRSFIP